jgi:hypothetical protein
MAWARRSVTLAGKVYQKFLQVEFQNCELKAGIIG